MSGGQHTPEQRTLAAAALAEGKTWQEAADLAGAHRTTVWQWTKDPEFDELRRRMRRQIVDGVVKDQVEALRALTPEAIAALARGLASTHKQRAMKVKELGVSDEGDVETEKIVLVDLADNSLAVHAADLVLKRIAEFAEKHDVTVGGSLEDRLREVHERRRAASPDG